MRRQARGSAAKDAGGGKSAEKARSAKVADEAGLALESPTRVFISYRRDDAGDTAAHLRYSLGKGIGAEKIFRDLDTIQPGQNFETAIQEAIRGTSVCLVLIGPQWLTLKDEKGRRRLDTPGDYVRSEVEAALRLGVEVIPVLVDGAKMPTKELLPESIRELAMKNAYELPWMAGISRLTTRIGQIERQREAREAAERAERERLDLSEVIREGVGTWQAQSSAAAFNVITRAMEISLARQGHKVWLAAEDIARSHKALVKSSLDMGFQFRDVRHIIDFVGVKRKRSNRRYIARSYPVKSFAEVPAQLALGRPVVVIVMWRSSWSRAPIRETGFIEYRQKERILGPGTTAILGWDPAKELVRLLLPWSTWGKSGMGSMTLEAANNCLDFSDGYSIEAVEMPASPFPKKD